MTTKQTLIFSFIIIGFSFAGGWLLEKELNSPLNQPSVVRDTVTVSDTIIQTDTAFYPHPQVSMSIIRDTMWLDNGDGEKSMVLSENKVYSDSTYTAWISGIEASLDSIEVYRKDNYITTIQKETVRETVLLPSDGFFLGLGANTHAGYFMPTASLNYVRGRFMYGVNTGILDGKPSFGVSLSLKLNK